MQPSHPLPTPGPQGLDDQGVEQALSTLADHDITEHAGIYEQLLTGLQHELNRTEHGA